MSIALTSFQPGAAYSNEEIFRSLGVGNAGGIRTKSSDGQTTRMVIMTSLPSAKSLAENPYHDRIEGDVLVYTGAGRVGDQTPVGSNAKIPMQVADAFPIWGFQQQTSRRDVTNGPKRWKFLGLLQFLRAHAERQVDVTGTERVAYVFELKIYNSFECVVVASDAEMMSSLVSENEGTAAIEESDREVALPTFATMESLSDLTHLEEIRCGLLNQEPKQFESTIAELLRRTGFQDVEVTRYSQDGGIDVNARPTTLVWPLRHLRVQVQAKRWLHTVGRREVAELRGSMMPHAVGCIVTTSHFSRAAIMESTDSGKVPISLIDGIELSRIIQSCRMTI